MKLIFASLALAISLLCGCEKKHASQPAQEMSEAQTANPTNQQSPIAEAGTAASAAAPGVQLGVNGLIDQARTLVSQTNYPSALRILQQVSGKKLTPEQQKRVWALKDQIRVSMAASTSGLPR